MEGHHQRALVLQAVRERVQDLGGGAGRLPVVMGFYHPATLVKGGQRHGVRFLPVDINHSGWRCRWEDASVRIGLRYVHGLERAAAEVIECETAKASFADTADLAHRCGLNREQLESLAHVGALASLGLSRRAALWQDSEVAGRRGPLLAGLPP